jgi:hypothetical protein
MFTRHELDRVARPPESSRHRALGLRRTRERAATFTDIKEKVICER